MTTVERVRSFKLEAADKAGGDSPEAGCTVGNNINFNVNAGETTTVTFDAGCIGKYLVLKPLNMIKLTLCRVRVYGTCSSKNLIMANILLIISCKYTKNGII